MARTLIVANQTLGGDDLARLVGERVAAGQREFYVLVPLTAVEHETDAWTGGFPVDEEDFAPIRMHATPRRESLEEVARRRSMELDEAERRARKRLEQMREHIAAVGGSADGEVSSAEPYDAVRHLLDVEEFDELVISALPARLSRWLRMDLPSRIERVTATPVTTVEAAE